jgi:hypothetical protein
MIKKLFSAIIGIEIANACLYGTLFNKGIYQIIEEQEIYKGKTK